MMSSTPSAQTIRGTLKALQEGDLTTVDLMTEILQRIQETDVAVQAWLDVRPQFLLETAAVMDRRRTLGRTAAPFAGIPIGVKDIVDLAGYQTQCNMRSRAGCEPAARDAKVVHQLRKAGALLVGKTVTQEAAAGVVSAPCTNPWDTTRIPGGSSGGSAAAVANGTCLGAIGTDTGGSIRIPASLCGVVGLKPTHGRTSLEGIFPLSASLDTVGPIARTVADSVALWLAMSGRSPEISATWERYPEAQTSLAGKRIGVLRSFFQDRLQPDVARRFDEAVSSLRGLGAEVVECDWDEAASARSVAMLISRMESAQVHRDALRQAPDLMGDALRSRTMLGAIMPADAWFRVRAARIGIRNSIAAVYRTHGLDAIAAPSVPATAVRCDEAEVHYADNTVEELGAAMTRLTQPWNATGQPVISLPCGFDNTGLPIGLSLVGRPDEEFALADIAHAYEQANSYWRMMPGQ
jgi:aspartyl-tRNA(Asn)/glutamyl-tRNA(Gln) amidotransferase subunit A